MKRPAFQFYPADWRNNAKLRRCSWPARGAWIDVMCLLHDSEEYGILRWPLKEIAQALGAPIGLLKELVDKDVLKGSDKEMVDPLIYTPISGRKKGDSVVLIAVQTGPIWFSSRMVTDEHIRQKKANHDLFKNSPNYSPMPPIGESKGEENKSPMPPKSDLPSSTSTSSIKTNTPKPPDGGSVGNDERKRGAIALQTFIEDCKAKGERPLRDYKPLWDYANSAGIEPDFIALAWAEFIRRFLPGGAQESKRQKDWRLTFRKYVENNYFKLWAIDAKGTYFLTSQGKQAQKFHESKAAA